MVMLRFLPMHKSEHPIIRPLPPPQMAGDFLAEPAGLCLDNCLFELRDYSRALIQFQRLVEINPRSLRGNLQIGSIYTCSDADDLFDLDVAE